MSQEFSGFDRDEGNRKKCQAHGVSLSEIEAMFANQPGISPDLADSNSETRFLVIGRNLSGRHIFMAFTIRMREGRRLIRPTSARYMPREEIEHYEKTHP